MAVIIIIPGIALYGILGNDLAEPDMAFPYLVSTYIPTGLKGIILCGLFASLMSTVDSTFNSIATLWSIDIYSGYLNKKADDTQKIRSGQQAIIFSFFSALTMGWILLYLKFENPSAAFTHTLNELRYYVNCGIVVLICSAVLVIIPNKKRVLWAFVMTLPLNLALQQIMPDMNYFVRAFCTLKGNNYEKFRHIYLVALSECNSFKSLQSPKNLIEAKNGTKISVKELRLGIVTGLNN